MDGAVIREHGVYGENPVWRTIELRERICSKGFERTASRGVAFKEQAVFRLSTRFLL